MKKASEMFSDVRLMFDDFEKMFDELDGEVDAAEPPTTAGETVTTKREETRPDGTRIVTTITKTKTVTVQTVRKGTP